MAGSTIRSAALGALTTLLVLGVAALGFMYSGLYDVSATSGTSGPMAWVLETTMERSVAARLDEVPAMPAVDSAGLEHGFEHFRAMCVGCHGAPGVEAGETGQGLEPEPPELAALARRSEPRELFWVTKHGIKMTGMPAFGVTHSDEQLWGIVAVLQRLAELSPEDYAAWEARFAAADSAAAAAGEPAGHTHAPGTPEHGH